MNSSLYNYFPSKFHFVINAIKHIFNNFCYLFSWYCAVLNVIITIDVTFQVHYFCSMDNELKRNLSRWFFNFLLQKC